MAGTEKILDIENDSGSFPRITFGVIVCNGEPFIASHFRALYPHAHQIIIVEGAAPGARSFVHTDGHSNDGTVETLQYLCKEEDPDGKLTVVYAEDEGHKDGFWPGEKDEQSRAFAKRASGDYLWQVDIDEFYMPETISSVRLHLLNNPTTTGASFRQITFWGGADVVVDGIYLRRGARDYHRLFKWEEGYKYDTHRPPTVINNKGKNLRECAQWLQAKNTFEYGWSLFHYSLVFEKQVKDKCAYYADAHWSQRSGANEWFQKDFIQLRRRHRPHNVYDHASWLEFYHGVHPPMAQAVFAQAQRDGVRIRGTEDVVAIIRSPSYRVARTVMKLGSNIDQIIRRVFRIVRSICSGWS